MKTHKHELALQAMHASNQQVDEVTAAANKVATQVVVAQEVVETGIDDMDAATVQLVRKPEMMGKKIMVIYLWF